MPIEVDIKRSRHARFGQELARHVVITATRDVLIAVVLLIQQVQYIQLDRDPMQHRKQILVSNINVEPHIPDTKGGQLLG